MVKTLLVFGGNGFVGSAICKYALDQGIKVIAMSRSGRPRNPAAWQSKVEYLPGDALTPSTYNHLLPSVSGIIHSVGVLLDSKFKLDKTVYEGSYEQMNRDTAISVINQIQDKNIPFTYISSERGIFFAPGYLSTKREVEAHLAKVKESVPYAVIRPGFMYSKESLMLKSIASVINLLNLTDSLYKVIGLEWYSNTFVPAKSLNVEIVAKVAVLSLWESELRHKTLDVADIVRESIKY